METSKFRYAALATAAGLLSLGLLRRLSSRVTRREQYIHDCKVNEKLIRSLAREDVSGTFRSAPDLFSPALAKTHMGLANGLTWNLYEQKFAALRSVSKDNVFTLYVVRHGEGTHNVAERLHGTPFWEASEAKKPEYLDTPLTEEGWRQAQELREKVDLALANGLKVDVIVVSPLRRAIDTAKIVFHSIWGKVPVISVENARETLGRHTCDKRRPLRELQELYPDVEFFLDSEEDELWTPERETDDDRRRRAKKLLNFFSQLSVTYPRIALVAHGGIIRAVSNNILGRDHLGEWLGYDVEHCEFLPTCVIRPKQDV